LPLLIDVPIHSRPVEWNSEGNSLRSPTLVAEGLIH
jgi:hypothetical protein